MYEKDVIVTTKYGQMPSFVACPDAPGQYPGIIFYMDAPGIREELRNMTRRIAKQGFRAHPLVAVAAYRRFLAEGFLRATYQEERYAVLAVAGERRCLPFQNAGVLPLYRRLILAARWWDLVDDLSCRVGEALVADRERVATTLLAWALGKDVWLRRAAIICQRKLRARTDIRLLFACIEPSLGNDEFFLRKGIGWALRSLAYHAPDEVRRYVREHAARLSPLSQKEALRHIGA